MAEAKQTSPVVIKKYANRRLYDTGTSAYITLEDLCARVKEGKEFVVVDAKSGQDLTRQVLTQIILEQETKGFKMLPTSFLRDVIQHYDNSMQEVFQGYMEGSMKSFVENQERIRGMFTQGVFAQGLKGMGMDKAMESIAPSFGNLEDIARQNMAMFEKAVQMFNPFANMFSGEKDSASEIPPTKNAKS